MHQFSSIVIVSSARALDPWIPKIFSTHISLIRYAVVELVKSLHYKPEGRGFYSSWGYCGFSITYSYLPDISWG